MASELAAGRTPDEAFTTSAALLGPRISADLLAATRTSPSDADPYEPPVERLEELALKRGAEGLRLLAACWRIGAERGGALATVLDGLAAALRDEETQRQEIATQLAGPRATARLLAGLPLLGLGMAAALGADPLAFLFTTPPGLGCLLAGIGLNALGLWWTRRLAHGAAELR